MTASEAREIVPYELLDESDPVLTALGELIQAAVEGFGARASLSAYVPGTGLQPLTVSLKAKTKADAGKMKTLVAAFRRDHGVNLKPSVEDATLYFTVPADVIGVHGRVTTYSNNECHDYICRLAWARRADVQKQARIAKLKANPDAYPHGDPYTYKNYGCDCRPCKDAWAAFVADYRARKRAATPPTRVAASK